MKLTTLADVYLEQLQDMYNAEGQLTKALPKLAKAASHEELAQAFKDHLEETKDQMEKIGGLIKDLGKKPGGKKCPAMEGLVKEGAEFIEEDAEDNARDAALVCAAQKVEHYEIASYGCLREWAEQLGHSKHVKVIEGILEQEKAADAKLNEIATSAINAEAMSG